MHTIFIGGLILAAVYGVWNSFTLMVRVRGWPEQVRAVRSTSVLGFLLFTASVGTWFLGRVPPEVSLVMGLTGVWFSSHAFRAEVRLVGARELATAAAASVGEPQASSGLVGGRAVPAEEHEAPSPDGPGGHSPHHEPFQTPVHWKVLEVLVFFGSCFAAWQFEGHGGGWPMWLSLATVTLGSWGYRRLHHPDSGPLPALTFFLSIPTAIVMTAWAAISVRP